MNAGARWAVVVLVLAVAGVVALWPRSSDQGIPIPQTRPAQDLAVARDRAALRPCPTSPESPSGPWVLRGVTVTCLGDGGQVDVSSVLSGRTVVNFWATWCVPCQEELKVLDAYARTPGAASVVTVLVESKEADGLELLAKLGVRLPSVVDRDESVREAVRVPPRLPVSYLVDGGGSLTEVTEPLVFTSVDQVREVVG